jgi:hypothetical protein
MSPLGYEKLKEQRQEMTAKRVEKDCQRAVTEENEDKAFQEHWSAHLAQFEANIIVGDQNQKDKLEAALKTIDEEHRRAIIYLEGVFRVRRDQKKQEMDQLKDRLVNQNRAALKKQREEENQQRLASRATQKLQRDEQRATEDDGFKNALLKTFDDETGIGNSAHLVQGQAGSPDATQSVQTFSTPHNGRPGTSLEPRPKRCKTEAGENNTLQPRENGAPSFSPAKAPGDIPSYNGPMLPQTLPPVNSPSRFLPFIGRRKPLPSSRLSKAKPANNNKHTYNQFGRSKKQYPQVGSYLGLPGYTGQGTQTPIHAQGSHSTCFTALALSAVAQAKPLEPEPLDREPFKANPLINKPVSTGPSVPSSQQGPFYRINVFRCGQDTFEVAPTQSRSEVELPLTLRADEGRKVFELYSGEACRSQEYPETVLDCTSGQKLYYCRSNATLEMNRFGRSIVKVDFHDNGELLGFLKLFATFHESKVYVKEKVPILNLISHLGCFRHTKLTSLVLIQNY